MLTTISPTVAPLPGPLILPRAPPLNPMNPNIRMKPPSAASCKEQEYLRCTVESEYKRYRKTWSAYTVTCLTVLTCMTYSIYCCFSRYLLPPVRNFFLFFFYFNCQIIRINHADYQSIYTTMCFNNLFRDKIVLITATS